MNPRRRYINLLKRALLNETGLDGEAAQVRFVEGYFNESLPGAPIETIDWTGVRWRKAAAQAVS